LRISCWCHLPVLELENQLARVNRATEQVDFAFVKDMQANNEELAAFFILRSIQTLGITEYELESRISTIIEQIIGYEEKMRGIALLEHKEQLEDTSWRAFGLLRTARIISDRETLKLLSDLRLACILNILKEIDPKLILKLLFQTQKGHLCSLKNASLHNEALKKARAEFIRDEFQKLA